MSNLRKFVFAVVASMFLPISVASAAVLSATNNQTGVGIFTTTGRLVHISTFSGLSASQPLTHVRFDGHAKDAFSSLNKPQLYFSPTGLSPGLFLFALSAASPFIVQTDIEIQNSSTTHVEPVSSSVFVPLTPTQSAGIANLLTTSGGAIDAWMLSTNNPNFYFPQFQVSFIPGFPPTPITENFSATVQFLTVPEPASVGVFACFMGVVAFFRRGLGNRFWKSIVAATLVAVSILSYQGTTHAEVLNDFIPQSGGPVELIPAGHSTSLTNHRSIYLGRLFQGDTFSLPVETIEAFASINNAVGSSASPQLSLWTGISSSTSLGSFVNAPTLLNTNLDFWTNQSTGIEARFVQNFTVAPTLGVQLQNLINANTSTGIDFWMVSRAPNSLFDAPAGSTSPQTNTFGVQITAVPEPASTALVVAALTSLAGYRTLRRRNA
jgi:hypothetical protein